nr:hypothetical protein Iba_chr02aCG23190 [Ipomoea batatas]
MTGHAVHANPFGHKPFEQLLGNEATHQWRGQQHSLATLRWTRLAFAAISLLGIALERRRASNVAGQVSLKKHLSSGAPQPLFIGDENSCIIDSMVSCDDMSTRLIIQCELQRGKEPVLATLSESSS